MMNNKRFTTENAAMFGKYFSEQGFWDKIKGVATQAGKKVVLPALLLYYVLRSRNVSLRDKGLIVGALGYLILPTDLVPDFLPLAGFADDVTALALVLKMVVCHVDKEIEDKAHAKAEALFG